MYRNAKKAKTSISGYDDSNLSNEEGELESNTEGNDLELDLAIAAAVASERAFSIELIREKILRYAISDNNGHISVEDVRNFREVQKNWLKTTSKLLGKSVEPLITLKLKRANSQADAFEVQRKGKLLDRFVITFTNINRMNDSLLPIKLCLSLEYFQEENFESLSKFLNYCGDGLMDLQITYPRDGGSMPVTFPGFDLPRLLKLSFQFSDQIYADRRQDIQDGPSSFGHNKYGLALLHNILISSNNLQELVIPFTNSDFVNIPQGFGFLPLPSSITSIEFKARLRSNDLRILLQKELPNLTHLTVLLHEIAFEWKLMHDVLEHVETTLKSFQVDGIRDVGGPRTVFRFPRLSKLETLYIDSDMLELYPTHLPPIRNKLNNVKRLFLHYQSKKKFLTRWTQDRKENVEKLSVSLVNETINSQNDNYFQSMSSEMMEMMNNAFPNVRRLTLTVNVNEMSCLTSLFTNMTGLRFLRINFEGNIDGSSSDVLDSILLGLPLELVISLKGHSEFLDSLRVKRNKSPSILNLPGLMTLHLWSKGFVAGGRISLFSKLLFEQGMMEMPNLLHLYLYGKFKPSPKMLTNWYKEGGVVMKYSAT